MIFSIIPPKIGKESKKYSNDGTGFFFDPLSINAKKTLKTHILTDISHSIFQKQHLMKNTCFEQTD